MASDGEQQQEANQQSDKPQQAEASPPPEAPAQAKAPAVEKAQAGAPPGDQPATAQAQAPKAEEPKAEEEKLPESFVEGILGKDLRNERLGQALDDTAGDAAHAAGVGRVRGAGVHPLPRRRRAVGPLGDALRRGGAGDDRAQRLRASLLEQLVLLQAAAHHVDEGAGDAGGGGAPWHGRAGPLHRVGHPDAVRPPVHRRGGAAGAGAGPGREPARGAGHGLRARHHAALLPLTRQAVTDTPFVACLIAAMACAIIGQLDDTHAAPRPPGGTASTSSRACPRWPRDCSAWGCRRSSCSRYALACVFPWTRRGGLRTGSGSPGPSSGKEVRDGQAADAGALGRRCAGCGWAPASSCSSRSRVPWYLGDVLVPAWTTRGSTSSTASSSTTT